MKRKGRKEKEKERKMSKKAVASKRPRGSSSLLKEQGFGLEVETYRV